MGVKGLWRILTDAGVPVSLESLEGKVLGVDVSIWFHQAMHGYIGHLGSSISNSHLLIMFHRICKLLFYRIRPIFIFDGHVPYLKKQTISVRRLRKEVALNKVRKTRERLLANILKSQAVRNALGKKGPGPSLYHVPKQVKKEKDLFELPPIDSSKDSVHQALINDDYEDKHKISNSSHNNLHSYDLESKDFKELDIYAQHDVLFDMQVTRKENSWGTVNEMPHEATDFSQFQMGRLLKRQKFQLTLDDVRIKIQKLHSAEMEKRLLGELENYVSHSQRIASEESAHSILSKKLQSGLHKKEDLPIPSKRKCTKNDFLVELSKSGLINDIKDTLRNEEDSSLSDDSDCIDSELPPKKKLKLEETNFMKAMDYALDDSELTQEEILSVIKQTKNETSKSTTHSQLDEPCASQSSSTFYIEEPLEINKPFSTPLKANAGTSINSPVKDLKDSNVKAILGAKTNSLYLKIVQQKLDEIVNSDGLTDVSLDTRKLDKFAASHSKVRKEKPSPNKMNTLSHSKEEVVISLDFNRKMNKDDIFDDIFLRKSPSKKACLISQSEDSLKIDKHNKDITCLSSINKEQVLRPMTPQDSSFQLSDSRPKELPNHSPNHTFQEVSNFQKEKNCATSKNDLQKSLKCQPSNKAISFEELALENLVDSYGIVSEDLKNKVNELVKDEIEKIIKSDQVKNLASVDSDKTITDENESVQKCHNKVKSQPIKINISSISSIEDASPSSAKEVPNKVSKEAKCSNIKPVNSQSSDDESDSSGDFIDVEEPSKTEDKEDFSVRKRTLHGASGSLLNQTSFGDQLFPQSMTINEGTLESLSQEKGLNSNFSSPNQELEPKETFMTKEVPHPKQLDYEDDSTDESLVDVEESSLKINEVSLPIDSQLPTSNADLTKMEKELASEQEQLHKSMNTFERSANSLSNQMYSDAQELLQLFGLPYLVAPAEAEAQCAFLESVNLSQGTITDDSDIFLFGGKKVYKNFFLQSKHVEVFNVDNIYQQLGLNKNKMISLALLTGSDYTMGIESIGSVLAMEIISEFPGEGIDNLNNLKKWWDASQKNLDIKSPSKIKQRLQALHLPDSFPSENVYNAYLSPDVDESTEKFSWTYPDADRLKVFAMDKFGWSLTKSEEILNPLFKKIGTNLSQRRLDSYFDIKLTKDHKHTSRRLKDAIAKVKSDDGIQDLKDKLDKKPCTEYVQKVPKAKELKCSNSNKSSTPLAASNQSILACNTDSIPENENSYSPQNLILGPLESSDLERDNLDRGQKRNKEFKKIFDRHLPESSQAQADKQKMENRKRFAAEILQKEKANKLNKF